jgi:DNA-binding response OmpR family regulator
LHGKICVIDDSKDITTSFKLGLQAHGYKVDVYNDPVKALAAIIPEFYDLLLIDIRMPNMNGFELCGKIRQRNDATKICFITSFQTYYEALLEEYPKIDHKCFIKKPIEITELVRIIESELSLGGKSSSFLAKQ